MCNVKEPSLIKDIIEFSQRPMVIEFGPFGQTADNGVTTYSWTLPGSEVQGHVEKRYNDYAFEFCSERGLQCPTSSGRNIPIFSGLRESAAESPSLMACASRFGMSRLFICAGKRFLRSLSPWD